MTRKFTGGWIDASMHIQEFLQVKTHSFTIFNGHYSTGQQCCQKDCAEALCSTEWFSLLESRLVEPKDALERVDV